MRHGLALAGRHLRIAPVNGIDLRPRGVEVAKEVVTRPLIDAVKIIVVEVVEHVSIPRQRLLAAEGLLYHHAAAAADMIFGLFADAASGQIREADLRPRRSVLLLFGARGRDFTDNLTSDLLKQAFDIANLCSERLLHQAHMLFKIVGLLF